MVKPGEDRTNPSEALKVVIDLVDPSMRKVIDRQTDAARMVISETLQKAGCISFRDLNSYPAQMVEVILSYGITVLFEDSREIFLCPLAFKQQVQSLSLRTVLPAKKLKNEFCIEPDWREVAEDDVKRSFQRAFQGLGYTSSDQLQEGLQLLEPYTSLKKLRLSEVQGLTEEGIDLTDAVLGRIEEVDLRGYSKDQNQCSLQNMKALFASASILESNE